MKIFVVLVFLFSAPAYALEIVLDRTNHSGFRLVNSLKKEQGQYSVDGKKIGATLPGNIQKVWNEIEKGPVSLAKKPFCSSGTYTFLKKENKKTQRRTGCTDGESYGRLIQNIETLRAYAKGI